jgi:hypothetical protein
MLRQDAVLMHGLPMMVPRLMHRKQPMMQRMKVVVVAACFLHHHHPHHRQHQLQGRP